MQNGNPKAEDTNRFRKQQAVRILERLIKQVTDPEFTGHVTLRIDAKNGLMMPVRSGCDQIHAD